MNALYFLTFIIPIACIVLAMYVVYRLRFHRDTGIIDNARPSLTKADIGLSPKLRDKDPYEGKIVVPRPLNRNQRRLLKKDAKKWAKAEGFNASQANAMAEATVQSVVVDPKVAMKRKLGAYS